MRNGKPPRKPTTDELRIWEMVTQNDKLLPNASIDWQAVEREIEKPPVSKQAAHVPADVIDSLLMPKPFTRAGEAHEAPRTEGGLDRNSERRLRQGKFPIEATLDLHGMTRQEAFDTLCGFLQRGFDMQRRCVLVITGKGRFRAEAGSSDGVLRQQLPRWLSQEPCQHWVLRHSKAQPHHGGDGAFYILLRRLR